MVFFTLKIQKQWQLHPVSPHISCFYAILNLTSYQATSSDIQQISERFTICNFKTLL